MVKSQVLLLSKCKCELNRTVNLETGREKANFPAINFLHFCSEGLPLPLDAWDRLRQLFLAITTFHFENDSSRRNKVRI